VAPEFLSVTPQRLRCYVCGAFTESPVGWSYRIRLGGHSPVCHSCTSKAEQEIEQQTSSPNLGGGVVLGALAAAVGSAVWYSIAAGAEGEFGVVAIGIGWLVGKAVVLGSGNKRGPLLQLAAGVLAGAAILGGQCLILNHRVSKATGAGSLVWLSWKQFLTLFGALLAHGEGIIELLLLVAAISCAVVLPCADRLVFEPPREIRKWPRLIA
jgi:hypothetical protein